MKTVRNTTSLGLQRARVVLHDRGRRQKGQVQSTKRLDHDTACPRQKGQACTSICYTSRCAFSHNRKPLGRQLKPPLRQHRGPMDVVPPDQVFLPHLEFAEKAMLVPLDGLVSVLRHHQQLITGEEEVGPTLGRLEACDLFPSAVRSEGILGGWRRLVVHHLAPTLFLPPAPRIKSPASALTVMG